MKSVFRTVAIAVLVVAMSATFAQGRQGRGGQRGGRTSIIGLLNRLDVQTDLGLNDDQKSKLNDLRQANRGQRRNQGATRPTPEEMKARADALKKQVDGILTPEQVTRLDQIRIQIQGDRAVLDPDVQTQLGITEAQKEKIKSLSETYRDANRSVSEKARSGELDRNAAREATQKNGQTLSDELHKVLTQQQLDKLKDLGGRPFKADAQSRGGGRA